MIAIYWFRDDLRLCDQPSFQQACTQAEQLAPVFIHPTHNAALTRWGFERMGPNRKHALRSALEALKVQLRQQQSDLLEYQGEPCSVLIDLAKKLGIDTIFCEEIVAPEEQQQVERLRQAGLSVNTLWQSTLLAPHDLPFAIERLPLVFTEFRIAIEKAQVAVHPPADAASAVPPLPLGIEQSRAMLIADEPAVDFDARSALTFFAAKDFAGTQGGLRHARQYFERKLAHSYKATRNQLSGLDYSTKFSVWLATGALSARMIFQQLQAFEAKHGANDGTYWLWFELLWRDYFRFLHLRFGAQLYHRSGLRKHTAFKQKAPNGIGLDSTELTAPAGGAAIDTPVQAQQFERWCHGECGDTFVDAGMRELKHTGYLSNRMRQVTASYLIHTLKLDWRAGAAWFEAQLIDYDVYSNQGNWLYIAGLGTDPRGGRAMRTDKQALEYDRAEIYRKQWGTL